MIKTKKDKTIAMLGVLIIMVASVIIVTYEEPKDKMIGYKDVEEVEEITPSGVEEDPPEDEEEEREIKNPILHKLISKRIERLERLLEKCYVSG